MAHERLRKLFESLPDPRVQRTRRHKLPDIVLIVLIGTICGCHGWDQIYELARDWQSDLRTLLGLELPHGVPSADTLRRVMAALDPIAFRQAFITWAQELCQSTAGKLVSIDGKTVRGANRGADGAQSLHLVNVWVKENAMVLAQYATDVKSNEITAIPEVLRLLELKGAVVSIDAMGCQKNIAKVIRERGADYIFGLKGNQPALHQEVLDAFDAKTCAALQKSNDSFHECADKGHGRNELRRVWVLRDVDWLRHSNEWLDLKTLVLVESQRTIRGVTSCERRAYISSLDATAERMADLARGHWHIENRLHWVLDVTFGEDRARIAKKNGAENLALVRKIALNLLRKAPPYSIMPSTVAKQRWATVRWNYLETILSGGAAGLNAETTGN
jgi:predicted transposase YbfD/YdcC